MLNTVMNALKYKTLLLSVALMPCYTTASAQYIPLDDSTKITYKGNTIEFSTKDMTDTTMIVDETTGEEKMLITAKDKHPVLLNGEKIFSQEELYEADTTEHVPVRMPGLGSTMLKEYLLANLGQEIAQLKDGEYFMTLSDIITNKAGAVVYFKLDGITQTVTNESGVTFSVTIDEDLKEKFEDKIGELLEDAPKYPPATYDGKAVNSIIDNIAFQESFSVQGKKTVLR